MTSDSTTPDRNYWQIAVLLLRAACFLLFIGRAWQHIVWDAPFRSVLWDESLMKGVVEGLIGVQWTDYVTSETADSWIQFAIVTTGYFYLVCAISALRVRADRLVDRVLLQIGSFALAILAFLYCKEKFYQPAGFLEYSIQFLSPLALSYMVLQPQSQSQSISKKPNADHASLDNASDGIMGHVFNVMRIATVFTFSCHGLYAVGFYPVPGHFMDMTITVLGVENEGALLFLKIVGILDFIVSFLLFVPRMQALAFIYAAVWGTLTATARIASNVSLSSLFSDLGLWTFEFLIRTPHAIIPLSLLAIALLRKRYSVPSSSRVYNTTAMQASA